MGFSPNYSRINADWSRGDSRPLLRFQDPRLLFWNYDRFGFGQEFGEGQNAFRLTLTEQGLAQIWFHDPGQPRRGQTSARGVYNLERNWDALQSHLFGWMPMLTLAFIWLLVLVRRPRRTGRLLLTSAAILVGAHLFYWASGISYGPRYFYAALPALLLLSARGLQFLAPHTSRAAISILFRALLSGALLFSAPGYVEQYRGYNFVNRRLITHFPDRHVYRLTDNLLIPITTNDAAADHQPHPTSRPSNYPTNKPITLLYLPNPAFRALTIACARSATCNLLNTLVI